MLADALGIIGTGISAAVTWFGQLTLAVPGSANLIISMFFLVSSFGIILRPLYRGGVANLSRRQEPSERK